MSDAIIEQMRQRLLPSGTGHVVQLYLADYGMYNSDFISECIDELERMHIRAAVGDMPTKLEKLAYSILCDSAYIEKVKD